MPSSPSPHGEGSGKGAAQSSGRPTPRPTPSSQGEGEARPDKPVILAAIAGAHGVSGEVRLKLFGDGTDTLKRFGSFNDGTLTLTKIRSDKKGGGIARFKGVDDRQAAETLRGTELTVARSSLPSLDEGEYYHIDLIGLAVESDQGEAIGKTVNVLNYGAGDLIEIQKPDGGTFLVPMNAQAVPEWDEYRLVLSADFAE